jgi:hypothetical protein
MFTNWQFALRHVEKGESMEHIFPNESQMKMTNLLMAFRTEASKLLGVAASYGIDASPLRNFCHTLVVSDDPAKRAEIRGVLEQLEGALPREQRNLSSAPSPLPPPVPMQPPKITGANPGRSFKVLHDAVGHWHRGDVFTEYDLRMAHQPEIPSHIDPDGYFEDQINRLLKLQSICVIG